MANTFVISRELPSGVFNQLINEQQSQEKAQEKMKKNDGKRQNTTKKDDRETD